MNDSKELEAQATGMITALLQLLQEANTKIANLSGEIAILNYRLESTKPHEVVDGI